MDLRTELFETRIDGKPYIFMVAHSGNNTDGIWFAYAYRGHDRFNNYMCHVSGMTSEKAVLNLVDYLENKSKNGNL